MGNGALYMEEEENKCYLCGDDLRLKSYFISFPMEENNTEHLIKMEIREVCPECHHFFVYGTEEQKQKYKERRNIK